MGCCGNHDHNENENHNSNGEQSQHKKSHNWMMMICCLLPIALFVGILVVNGFSGNNTNIVPYLVLLICPLAHMVLMPMMGKKNH